MRNHTDIFKSLFSTMLVGAMAFSAVFALNGEKVYAGNELISIENENAECWEMDDLVDKLGDATGENCIKSVAVGTFGNAATIEGDLTVEAFITQTIPEYEFKDGSTILVKHAASYQMQFRLMEYNEMPVTHSNSLNMILKTKVGEEIETYTLIGNKYNNVSINPLISDKTGFERNGELLIKELYEGNDVRCVIEINSSKYQFTLKAGNLKEMIDENCYGEPLDAEGQAHRTQNMQNAAQLDNAESIIKSKSNFIAAYVNHTDADNNYESGYYYFNGHADEFKDLTGEELSAIFPCRFRCYLVNPVLAGTPGAGELYEYDAEGNTKLLGRYGLDDSYRTREEINPNWPEINGSWRIENGELIRTVTSTKVENKYKVKSLDHDGYYLLCGASGNGPAMMIVLYDENNMPLYEFTEE